MDYFLSCDDAEPEFERCGRTIQQDTCSPRRISVLVSAPAGAEPRRRTGGLCAARKCDRLFLAQNLFKIHPDMDAALWRFLDGDRKGRLVLLEGHDPRWGQAVREQFAGLCATRHCGLWSQNVKSHDNYMRLFTLSDVVLDSYPFSGGNTTYQAIAMGVPVVTCPGRYLRGRFSMATFERMGMSELVAGDMAEFADIALRLGTDDGYRREIRNRRAQTSDAIFDDPVYLAAIAAFSNDGGAPLGGQYQVVAVDEFVSATIAEDRCDLSALATGDPERIAVRVSGQPTGELLSGLATDNDGIAAFRNFR